MTLFKDRSPISSLNRQQRAGLSLGMPVFRGIGKIRTQQRRQKRWLETRGIQRSVESRKQGRPMVWRKEYTTAK